MTLLPTAEAIVQSARAIFEDEGAHGVSMRRVASAVGITPMAIYRHFPNREALLHRIADQGFQELADHWKPGRTRQTPERRILALLDHYLDYALRHPRIFDYVFSELRPGARRFPEDFRSGQSPTADLMVQACRDGMAQGQFKRDDVLEAMLSLWAHAHGLICLHRGGRFSLSAKDFKALYRRSLRRLLDGMRI
jgi:AcrR family transcriptional regulator